jgi:hypothetical protein
LINIDLYQDTTNLRTAELTPYLNENSDVEVTVDVDFLIGALISLNRDVILDEILAKSMVGKGCKSETFSSKVSLSSGCSSVDVDVEVVCSARTMSFGNSDKDFGNVKSDTTNKLPRVMLVNFEM